MATLFSPIGTADPITQLGDGPMLHIVRHYHPDKVVLFLSPAMAAHQTNDQRYTAAIELLSATLCRPDPEVELVESKYADVYRFDHYIEEFEAILERLVAEQSDGPIYVNATSGTPAMEQALVALAAFGRLDLKLLQVTTPKNDINSRFDREDPNDYDFNALWELNEDAFEGAPNRVHEVAELPNFGDQLLRKNVIALLGRFDYEAAYSLACDMRRVDSDAKEMMRAAADRLNLESQRPSRVFGGTDLAYKTDDPLVEYLYVMEVRLKQGHWAEFLRSMTPALTSLIKRCLNPYLPEGRYLQIENGRASDKIDYFKVENDPRLRRVFSSRDGDIRRNGQYVTNALLINLVDAYCEDEDAREKIRMLRNVESRLRNSLAHEVASSGKTRLEKEIGCSLDLVMKCFFDLCGNARPGLYERINEAVVAKL